MKVIEAIQGVDALKPNSYSQEDKIKWLSTLDGIIKTEIIDTHEGANKVIFNGYDNTSLDTELIVPAPYDDIYIKWRESQIDYNNGEIGRYTNSKNMYNTAYTTFERYYNRKNMPLSKSFKYF